MDKKIQIGIFILVVVVLIGGYFIFSGDSELTGGEDSGGTPSSQTYSGSFSELALDLSDLPEGYIISEKGPRTTEDVSQDGIDAGWSEGYVITFQKEDNPFDFGLDFYISRYPNENLTMIYNNDFYGEGNTALEVPISNFGDSSRAVKIQTEFLNFYRVLFIKKDLLITLGGQDFELLEELAKKVEKKI
jgi:hypothetical protein